MVLSLDRWVGKTAVVTGASSGVGANVAEQFVKLGINVVGLARRNENIEALSKKLIKEKGKLYAVKTDLRKEEDIINAFKWTKENVGPVHILINNAGLNLPNTLIGGDTEKWRNVLDVNVMALCIATREAIKQMQEHNIDGHIIHINSTSGHRVANLPNINVYSASKYGVTALAETLRLELNRIDSKIKISNVSPGPIHSEFIQTAGLDVNKPEFREMLHKMVWLKPEDVADGVVYVLSTPPHVQVQDLIMRPINHRF